jgi:hypothetical protein
VEKPDVTYEVGELPPHWRLVRLEDNDLAYLDEASGHSLAVNATCEGHEDPPLSVLTQHLLIGFTERQETERRLFMLDGREALETRHFAKLDGVPVDLLFVVMKKDGCVYDFTYVSPPGRFDQYVADFRGLVQGFHARERP